MNQDKEKIMENILWSIALPGFPQLLNGDYLKGFGFIALEIIINVQAKFNCAILFSFLGEIQKAIEITNYQWLLFYPCLYFYAMWDTYKTTAGSHSSYMFFPFVFSAYSVTVGLVLSSKVTIFGKLWGPVWLPMLFVIPGLIVGFILKYLFQNRTAKKTKSES